MVRCCTPSRIAARTLRTATARTRNRRWRLVSATASSSGRTSRGPTHHRPAPLDDSERTDRRTSTTSNGSRVARSSLGGSAPRAGRDISPLGQRARTDCQSVMCTLPSARSATARGVVANRCSASAAGNARPSPRVLACHISMTGVPRTSSRTQRAAPAWRALARVRRRRRVELRLTDEPALAGHGARREPACRREWVIRRGDEDLAGTAGTAPLRRAPSPGSGRTRCRRAAAQAPRRASQLASFGAGALLGILPDASADELIKPAALRTRSATCVNRNRKVRSYQEANSAQVGWVGGRDSGRRP